MLVHSLAWRKLHGVDTLLDHFKAPDVIKQYFAGAWHYQDLGKNLLIFSLLSHLISESIHMHVCKYYSDCLDRSELWYR